MPAYWEDNGTYWAYAPVPGKHAACASSDVDARQQHTKNSIGEAFYKASVTVELPLVARQAHVVVSRSICGESPIRFEECHTGHRRPQYLRQQPEDQTGRRELARKYTAQYMLICGFGLLDEVDPSVHRALIRLFSSRPDWFPGGWFGGPAGSMALSHFMRAGPRPCSTTTRDWSAEQHETQRQRT